MQVLLNGDEDKVITVVIPDFFSLGVSMVTNKFIDKLDLHKKHKLTCKNLVELNVFAAYLGLQEQWQCL